LKPYLAFNRLSQGSVLQEPEQRIERIYFIESGMISLVAMMQDGSAIETATLGRQAILGALSALGNHTAGTRAIVQIDATAWRMPVADFRTAVGQSPLLSAYSNEAGRVSRSYVGHTFQLDRGHRSNLIAAR
jgi:CRP-like cAMP-binding protein